MPETREYYGISNSDPIVYSFDEAKVIERTGGLNNKFIKLPGNHHEMLDVTQLMSLIRDTAKAKFTLAVYVAPLSPMELCVTQKRSQPGVIGIFPTNGPVKSCEKAMKILEALQHEENVCALTTDGAFGSLLSKFALWHPSMIDGSLACVLDPYHLLKNIWRADTTGSHVLTYKGADIEHNDIVLFSKKAGLFCWNIFVNF